jgi:hypothetical protein
MDSTRIVSAHSWALSMELRSADSMGQMGHSKVPTTGVETRLLDGSQRAIFSSSKEQDSALDGSEHASTTDCWKGFRRGSELPVIKLRRRRVRWLRGQPARGLVVSTVEGGPKARLMDSRKVLSLALDLEGVGRSGRLLTGTQVGLLIAGARVGVLAGPDEGALVVYAYSPRQRIA